MPSAVRRESKRGRTRGAPPLSVLLALWGLVAACAAGGRHAEVAPSERIVLETSLGEIVIEVDVAGAPKTAAYVLGLVDRGDLDGTRFLRSAALGAVPGEGRLIQGGMLHRWVNADVPPSFSELGLPTLDDFETTEETGTPHVRGAVSLARDLLESGVVVPDLVICVGAVPSMDQGAREWPDARGFPVFGRVVDGMEVVDAIAERETAGATSFPFLEGQILTEPVPILRATRGL